MEPMDEWVAGKGMQNMSSDMLVVINNLRRLLQSSPEGFEIGKLQVSYFNKFECFAYVHRLGFKNWTHMLRHPEIQKYGEFFNDKTWFKIRETPTPAPETPTPAPPASIIDVTVLQPVSKPALPPPKESIEVAENHIAPMKKPSASSSESECSSSSNASSKLSSTYRAGEMISSTVLGKRAGSESSISSTSSKIKHSKREKDIFDTSSESSKSESDFSEASHVSISASNRQKMSNEIAKIQWIPKDNSFRALNFNSLILEREFKKAEESFFIDTAFCDRKILEDLMNVKNEIKRVDSEKFTAVRAEHNIFEFQKGAIFRNGAAIKMANIDALMGMGLSAPRGPDGSNLIQSNELLYFVDVNGDPGGYAEYFLWKKKWQAKGFGITIKEKNDYKLEQAEHFPRESFEAFYGENANLGSGDIANPFYLSKFISFVNDSTDQRGAHIMIASGGDKCDTIEEDQKEIKCKYIFLAEFLLALKVVRAGGHFVCRIYDMFTPFTVGLIYLMYRAFEQVAVYKPEACMPACSEKYLLCKWKKNNFEVGEIANYLAECHKSDWLSKKSKRCTFRGYAEITNLLSLHRLKQNYKFYEYIRRTNEELGSNQLEETRVILATIRYGIQDRQIKERLARIQHRSLHLWGIPDRVREKPKYSKATTPAIRAVKLMTPYAHNFIDNTNMEGEMEMSMAALMSDLKNPKEWGFMAVGPERGFFMCLGGRRIYRHERGRWRPIAESLELMNNTLVYADLVDEYEINGSRQTIWTGFHIIDALILGGKDVRSLPSNERSDLIEKFSRSMNKTSRDDVAAIRPKLSFELKDIQKFLGKIQECQVRNRDGRITTNYLCPVDPYGLSKTKFLIYGILFMKRYKLNFVSADFRFCVQNRLYWEFKDGVNINVPNDFAPRHNHKFSNEELGDEDNVVPVHATTLLQHLFNCKHM